MKLKSLFSLVVFVSALASARGDSPELGRSWSSMRPQPELIRLADRIQDQTERFWQLVSRDSSVGRESRERAQELAQEANEFRNAVRREQGRPATTRKAYGQLYNDYRRAAARAGTSRGTGFGRLGMDRIGGTIEAISQFYSADPERRTDWVQLREAARRLEIVSAQVARRARSEAPGWPPGPSVKRKAVLLFEDLSRHAASFNESLRHSSLNPRELASAIAQLESDFNEAGARLRHFSPELRRQFNDVSNALESVKAISRR